MNNKSNYESTSVWQHFNQLGLGLALTLTSWLTTTQHECLFNWASAVCLLLFSLLKKRIIPTLLYSNKLLKATERSRAKHTRTRKHRWSYRHADHAGNEILVCGIRDMVTSNRATVTVSITGWPWPFDPWVNACWATAIEYMCTKFGVNSSSRFPFRAWTDRQMRLNAIATPAAMWAWPAWWILISSQQQNAISWQLQTELKGPMVLLTSGQQN